jgi:hypothetical protein
MFGVNPRLPDPQTWEQYEARVEDRRAAKAAHARHAERPANGLDAAAVYRSPEGLLFTAQESDGRWYLLPHPCALQFTDPDLFYVVTPAGALIECDAVAWTTCDVPWDLFTVTAETPTE